MRTAGIVILCLGLVMTLYSGVHLVTKEKVIDLGEVEVTADEDHAAEWSPLVGVAGIVAGGAMILLARRKNL